eukprot:EC721567.1.p1 GENE.EC721567.1~~EC721567.1.p1  ORF type:complete len:111 (+),score=7.66 EC721567.1:71-403(+)
MSDDVGKVQQKLMRLPVMKMIIDTCGQLIERRHNCYELFGNDAAEKCHNFELQEQVCVSQIACPKELEALKSCVDKNPGKEQAACEKHVAAMQQCFERFNESLVAAAQAE